MILCAYFITIGAYYKTPYNKEYIYWITHSKNCWKLYGAVYYTTFFFTISVQIMCYYVQENMVHNRF